MSSNSRDVILRFQGFKTQKEKKEIGGILASFVTGILESADDPKAAAHFCQYFLRERLSREERKRVANFVVVYENRPGKQKSKNTLLEAGSATSLSQLFENRKILWEVNDVPQ